jgi:hypothetical protein
MMALKVRVMVIVFFRTTVFPVFFCRFDQADRSRLLVEKSDQGGSVYSFAVMEDRKSDKPFVFGSHA